MDRHGVLLWRELQRPDEARSDSGGVHHDHSSRAAHGLGLSACGQKAT